MRREISVAALLTMCACGSDQESRGPKFSMDVSAPATPYTHLAFKNEAANFSFAIVGDRRGGSRAPGVFRTAVERLNRLQPALVMSVGDLAECCEPGDWSLRRFEDIVSYLEMPFFHVAGNADVSDSESDSEWRRRFGNPYYHFLFHDVLFVVLFTEDEPGSPRGAHVGEIGDEQRRWLEGVLSANRDVRWTFLFMHKPMWLHDQPEWLGIEAVLSDRDHTVFGGHHHRYTRSERNGSVYYTLSSTGSSLPSTGLVFDHIMWVAMTDSGPRVSNILLDGLWGDDPPAHVGVNHE